MAEPDPTSNNVTPIGRPLTSTERSRIHRQRKRAKPRRKATAPATLPPVTVQRADATLHQVPHESRTVTAATLVAALALATCSAAFSINGLTSIFAGAFWAVIGLGVAFEIGKLSAVAWLGSCKKTQTFLRLALVFLVLLLMGLNSIGVYGFLSKAHIEHAVAGDITVASKAADVEARLTVQAGIVADIDRRMSQIDSAVEESIKRGRSKSGLAMAEEQKKNRAQLAEIRQLETGKLSALKVEAAKVDGERKAVEADLGPARYLATLLGSTDEQTMRWFALAPVAGAFFCISFWALWAPCGYLHHPTGGWTSSCFAIHGR